MQKTGRNNMRQQKQTQKLLVMTLTVIVLFFSCEEDPQSIYNPDVTGNPTPAITHVAPDSNYSQNDVSFAGEGVVIITGSNFSAVSDYNMVFFNGLPGEVLTASETSLRVRVPVISGDSIIVRISVQGAFQFAEYETPFEIVPAVIPVGGFDDFDQLYSLACDVNDALWVTTFGNPTIKMYSVFPDSLKKLEFSTLTVSSTGLKYGGNDLLFLTGGALLYAMDKTTGLYNRSYLFPFAGSDVTRDLDFLDSNHVFVAFIKAPNKGYVMGISFDTGIKDTLMAYDSLNIKCVRVFDNDLYVSGFRTSNGANTAPVVYKNHISGFTLGASELVLDLADYPDYAGVQINAMTFSADGKLFLGLDAVQAILVYENFELKPFYNHILSPPTRDLVWGNGDYLYQLQATRVSKINMVEAGAAYAGRQ